MRFSLGLDLGTTEARAVAVDALTGRTLASSRVGYSLFRPRAGAAALGSSDSSSGNRDEEGSKRDGDGGGDDGDGECTVRAPSAWISAVREAVRVVGDAVRALAAKDHVDAGRIEVVGVGVACTSCTVVPVDEAGVAMSEASEKWRGRKHARGKMWKHHGAGAAAAAEDIVEAVRRLEGSGNDATKRARTTSWLDETYGGTLSLEWFHPKLLEVYRHDRDVFHATSAFVEAGDWVVWHLCGRPPNCGSTRSACQAGYKACYDAASQSFWLRPEHLIAAEPSLATAPLETWEKFFPTMKRATSYVAPGSKPVGFLAPEFAQLLFPGNSTPPTTIPVSAAAIDAHAAALALGASKPGRMTLVAGTSGCYMACAPLDALKDKSAVGGLAGVVPDGIAPGLLGIETGQAAVGDAFAWLARVAGNVPVGELDRRARTAILSKNKPPPRALWAVDHVNGCRTPRMDPHATGSFGGLTLDTTPELMFCALAEAVAFGVREVVDVVRAAVSPLQVSEFVLAGGGPAHPEGVFCRLLPRALNADVVVAEESDDATARGAAVHGLGVSVLASPATPSAPGALSALAERVSAHHLADAFVSFQPSHDAGLTEDPAWNWCGEERRKRYREKAGLVAWASSRSSSSSSSTSSSST